MSGPLRDRLIVLAGTPDDAPVVATDLVVVAQLTADRVDPVAYASVTSAAPGGHTTVAASSDLAAAVDQAQYADEAGPCLEALETGRAVTVPEIAAVMAWPGFRDMAAGLGLRTSLSIPMFAGRGTTLAALNLYSRDPAPMWALASAVQCVYAGAQVRTDLDVGGRELIAGLAGAFEVRMVIQQALGVIMGIGGDGPAGAYAALCKRAAEAGIPLTEMATRLTSGQHW